MSDEKVREQREDALLRRLLRLAGKPVAVSDQLSLRVKENVHHHWKRQLRSNARKRMTWIFSGTIAASFLVAITLWFSLAFTRSQPIPVAIVDDFVGSTSTHAPDSPGMNLISRRSILFTNSILETNAEASVLLRILGGAKMRVDPSSRVRFQSDSVLVLERGVVNLDTGKTRRHFIVSTSMGNVTDIGTRFQVRFNENRIEIRVQEGSVALNQNGKRSHSIAAGNRLVANANGEVLMSKLNSLEMEGINQLSSEFNLEGRTLMEFLQWICNENGWKLKFSDSRMEKKEAPVILHGTVSALLPQQMLAAVLPVCGLNYRLKDGTLTITN